MRPAPHARQPLATRDRALAMPTAVRDVPAPSRDRLLFALTASSGAIDAISFLALGKVFTAFMTGNTVFLGLRLAGAAAPGADALLASMGGFAAGVWLATWIVASGADAAARSRRVSSALALSLLAHALFIALWLACHARPSLRVVPALLASWALAMGMQSGAVRALHVDSVFTTAATGSVIGLAADLTSWRASGAEIHRLAFVLLSLVAGATAGGALLRHAPRAAPLLPFVVTLAVALLGRKTWSTG